MTVRNRLVMPPMSLNFGVDEDGRRNAQMIRCIKRPFLIKKHLYPPNGRCCSSGIMFTFFKNWITYSNSTSKHYWTPFSYLTGRRAEKENKNDNKPYGNTQTSQ